MTGNLGTLVVRLALELKRYKAELSDAVRETHEQMGRAQRGTQGLTADTKKLEQQAGSAAREFGKLDRAVNNVDFAKPSAGLASLVGNVGRMAVLTGVGTVLTVIGSAAVKLAGDLVPVQRRFDVLNSSMVTVTGSSRAAAKEMAWIKSFAATTPFQLGEVTSAFVKLKAMGLDPSEASLRSYGNTASAMGKNVNQMIEAVADAATGEFERLKEFGIRASVEGDKVSFTFQGVTTTVRNSAEEITGYLRSLGDVNFAGAMAERAATLDGTLSNLADSWENFVLAVSQSGVGDAIGNTARAASTHLQALSESLEQSKARGEGFFMSMANAAGMNLGRGAFGLLQGSANLLNGALHELSFGVLDFNQNLDLIPDNLKLASAQTEIYGAKIKQAEAEYAALTERLKQAPDNIWIKSDLGNLARYIAKLREARSEQQALMGRGAEAGPVGSVGSGDAALARAQRADYERRKAASEATMRKYATPQEKLSEELKAQRAALGDLFTPALEKRITEHFIKPTRASKKAAREARDEFAELYNKLSAKDVGMDPSFYKDLNTLHDGYQKGRIGLDEYRAAVENLVGAQRFATEATQELAKAQEADAKANAEATEAQQGAAAALQEKVAREREAIEVMGLTRVQVAELEAAKLDETAATKLRLAAIADEIDWSGQLGEAYRAEAAQLQELAQLKRDGAAKQVLVDAADDAKKAWEKTADSIESTLTDALMRGFESGKGFGESLADSLVNMFKTYVAREIAASISKALMSSMGGQGGWLSAIGSMFGMGGGGGGGGGGGVDYMKLANAAYKYYTAGAGAGASAGTITNGMTQAQMLSAQEAGMGGGAGASSGSAAGTYMTWAAFIYAFAQIASNLYNKGYTRAALGHGNGDQEFRPSGVGTTGAGSGTSFQYEHSGENYQRQVMDSLGLFSEKWRDILSGTTRMATLFGRKLKAFGLEANINGLDTQVSAYERYKGGLFRSNKTIHTAATDKEVQALQNSVDDVRESSKALARAMGYSDDAIDSFVGSIRVNFKNARTGEEAAKRYAEAMEDLQRQMVNTATGLNMSKEQFSEFMDGIQASVQEAGISVQGLEDILTAGMMGRLSEAEVGAQMADMILGGIYESLAGDYAAQIASMFSSQIITPIFTALAAGVPISQAISQTAIANIVKTAQDAAAALNAIFSNAEFQQAMAQIGEAIKGVSVAVTRVKVPKFGSAKLAANNQEAQTRYQLETQLLTLLGQTDKLRQRELASLSASNRALQQRIWAIEDAREAMDDAYAALERAAEDAYSALERAAEDAYSALERAADKQREVWQKELDAATELEGKVKDVFDLLKESIRDLRSEVDSTLTMQADAGRALIRAAIGSGVLPDADDLADAIDAVSKSLDETRYGSATDRARDMLVFANELEALQGVVEPQLSAAEQQVALLESQLEALDLQLETARQQMDLQLETARQQMDLQLETARQQMDALLGIDTSVKTVEQAVASLSKAMAAYAAAVAAGQAVSVSSGAAPGGGSSGGGSYSGGGGGGGGGSSKGWTADGYWAKNPDLQKEFTSANLANSPDFNKDPNLSARDEYLAWHWATRGQKEKRKFASGAAFTNGIVSRPTLFDVGQMGEKTPEGILPLANVGGRLGVHSVTGSDEQTKALLRDLIAEVRASRSEGQATALHTSRVRDVLERVTQKGNAVAVKTLAGSPLATKEVTA